MEKVETRQRRQTRRAPDVIVGNDAPEISAALRFHQASWLRARANVSPLHALALAELHFSGRQV